MQRTLVLIKPDAVQRGLSGDIIARLERRGLKLVGLKMIHVTPELAHRHYGAHVDKPFFEGLVDFITSSPLIAIAVEGENAVDVVRSTMGATNPVEASPGTIRGDFGLTISMNLIHGSDSPESAETELALFFGKGEIIDYERGVDDWIIES
ncbi:MAG: nucleoside-diphosphate kinase [Chloroflexi bacterium]|nr:nucleoside-diphosphate kinase [Chloroflexota bacterium]